MSTCAQVSKFGSSVSCKQSTFQQKIHSKWKMWMLNLKQKASTDAKDSQECLWYCIVYHFKQVFYLFWSCELRANIDCTCTIKLKWHFNYTHPCMTSHFSKVMFSKTSIFMDMFVIFSRICWHLTKIFLSKYMFKNIDVSVLKVNATFPLTNFCNHARSNHSATVLVLVASPVVTNHMAVREALAWYATHSEVSVYASNELWLLQYFSTHNKVKQSADQILVGLIQAFMGEFSFAWPGSIISSPGTFKDKESSRRAYRCLLISGVI